MAAQCCRALYNSISLTVLSLFYNDVFSIFVLKSYYKIKYHFKFNLAEELKKTD